MREAALPQCMPDASPLLPGDGTDTGAWRFFAVLTIENFALLRRHLGQAASVKAIEAVAARVASLAPDAALVVVGRDTIELTAVCAGQDTAEALLFAIEQDCARPFAIRGTSHHVELLLGASVAHESEHDDLRLVEDAEHALDEARAERRLVVRTLTRADCLDRIALKRDLGAAIADQSLFVHYQPKVHLRRGEIAGVEALLRWRHPVRGLISPADFIPIAEETRDIFALTLWTLRQVIEDQLALARLGHDHIVFVNISGVLLGDPRFVDAVQALVPPSGAQIGFEITETSVIRDPDSAIANLKLFADMGITVAIDDYGAGLSSLAYLKQLPARELKIDKLFITQLTSSHRDPLIVRSTIDLAHALDMEVVAEGVETATTLALLSVMGCDMAQGFLMSRPIGFDALVTFLQDYSPAVHVARPAFTRLAAGMQRG